MELLANGYQQTKITTILSPAWTTDWMSEEEKQKLKNTDRSTLHKQQAYEQELLPRIFIAHAVIHITQPG
jgi:metal-sulfur cluster biosynthetic enzyme